MRRGCAGFAWAALFAGPAGCGAVPSGDPSPEPKPVDYVELVENSASTVTVPGAQRVEAASAWLASPHYVAKFAWVATVDALDAQSAPVVGARRPVRSAPGHDLVLAGLDLFATTAAWDDPDAKVTTAIAVGDHTVALKAVPEPGDVLAVSAPEGTPVLLRIVDANRSFSYDLRTGRPGKDPYWWRSGTAEGSYRGTGRLAVAPRSRTMSVTMGLGGLSLGPWVPSKGWSRPGRAWLLLTRVTVSSNALSADFERGFPVTFSLDTVRTFAVTLPGGTRLAPVRAQIEAAVGANAIRGVSVLFDVPVGFRQGRLRLTPDGPIVAQFSTAKIPLTWRVPPPAKTFPLSV
jgi:hypothetical protein